MPTRSGTIHGDNGSVGDSDYLIYTASLMNDSSDILPLPYDSSSYVKSIADSGRKNFAGGDDPQEFYIHERHFFEPNGDSSWQYGYGTANYFGESDMGITIIRPHNDVLLDSANANVGGGGGGADQAELDSANALIVTLRDDVDSAETLITTLRGDLDSAESNTGTSGPVQRWVT